MPPGGGDDGGGSQKRTPAGHNATAGVGFQFFLWIQSSDDNYFSAAGATHMYMYVAAT